MGSNKLNSQVLILTVGYPGSGKTHVSRQLAEDLGIARVSADRIRYELFEQPTYSRDEEAIIFSILNYMTEEMLRSGQSVIVDADFGLRKSRRLKYELARQFKAKPLLLWVQTDVESARLRSRSRNGRKTDDKYSPNMDNDSFERLVQRFKNPQAEPAIVVSGKHGYKIQKKNIMRKLQQVGLLEGSVKPTTEKTDKEAADAAKFVSRKPTNRVIPRNQRPLRVSK